MNKKLFGKTDQQTKEIRRKLKEKEEKKREKEQQQRKQQICIGGAKVQRR